MQRNNTYRTHMLNQRHKLTRRLRQLTWLEWLWDERVTRLLRDYPAHAGDCAFYRDAARERLQQVAAELAACKAELARLPA